MRTNYHSRRFVGSYGRARRFSPVARDFWTSQLTEHTPAESVLTVLDVGAGTGRFWPVLQSAWSPQAIVAVDRSFAMLQAASTRRGVIRVVGDIDALPIPRAAGFDVAFCSMSLQYSQNPSECVKKLKAAVRPGGWLYIRIGTHETLSSFDFLKFFPTALAAERTAMPMRSELLTWMSDDGLEVINIGEVSAEPPASRVSALRTVLTRGFPSLQMVSSIELSRGSLLYTLHLVACCILRRARPTEQSVLVVARRRA